MKIRYFYSIMLFICFLPFKLLSQTALNVPFRDRIQSALITLTVPINDKALAESINSSIISGMEEGYIFLYQDNELSRYLLPNEVKLASYAKKKLKSISASILWDYQTDVASIFSLGPNYNVNDTPVYLFEGDFKAPTVNDLRALIWTEFMQRVNNSTQKSTNEKYTTRTISFSESDCLYNFPLSVIPQMLYLKATEEYSISIFSDPMLENEMRPKDLEENYVDKNDNVNINQKASKPSGIQSIVLFEEWQDTTYQYLGLQNDGIHSKVKKVKSIGLIYPGNKIAWFNYDEYKNMLLVRNKKLFDVYNLIFDSHFSKLMNVKLK